MSRRRRRRRPVRAVMLFASVAATMMTAVVAEGQEPSPPAPPSPTGAADPDTSPNPDADADAGSTAAPAADANTTSPVFASVPPPTTTTPSKRGAFKADPIIDGAIILLGAGFAGILDLVNGTGEVRPQQISPTFDRSQLLGIDRGALSQRVDPNAGTYSNIGLFTAGAFAAIDPILSGLREKSVKAAVVDGVIYAEAIAVTWGVTNLAKMAVRRPRPAAYVDAEAHKNDLSYSNADTDSSLSFFSGHASVVACISATATYLAFARSSTAVRPWITLLAGSALTTFVAYERVRAGKHFPTDVIAGGIAGAGVGIIVPYLHREADPNERPVWVGFTPAVDGRGGVVQLSVLQ